MPVDHTNGSDRAEDAHEGSAAQTDSSGHRPDDREGPAAMRHLFAQWEELVELVHFYIAARSDAIRSSLRSTLAWAVVGFLVLFVLTACLVTCAVILVLGIAQLIAHSLGDRLWAGYLIAGGGLLLVCGLALWLALSRFTRSSRERTFRKYARRREEQRSRFGHDVAERSGRQDS